MNTLLKHLVPSCSNKEVKPKLPKKKVHNFFSETPFLTKFFSKTLILHHPLITVHQKISKKTYFYGSKKDGQVINSTMAKLLTQLWPKNGQVINPTACIYIYIYIAISISISIYICCGVSIWANFPHLLTYVDFCRQKSSLKRGQRHDSQ